MFIYTPFKYYKAYIIILVFHYIRDKMYSEKVQEKTETEL